MPLQAFTQKEMATILRLIIAGLDLDEIKELLRHLREFEEKNPSRLIACIVQGLEEKSVEEAKKVLREIFPTAGVGG